MFDVSEFGAVAGSDVDAGPAIRRAIDAAEAFGGPSEVRFGDGVYLIGSIGDGSGATTWWSKAHLVVSGARDIVIAGSGQTVLAMTDPGAAGIVVKDCERVTAENFTVDYLPAPMTMSKVVAIDPNHNFIQVEPLSNHADLIGYDNRVFQDAATRTLGTTYQVSDDGRVSWGLEPLALVFAGQTGVSRYALAVPYSPSRDRRDTISVAGLRLGDLLVDSCVTGGAAISFIHNRRVLAQGVTLWASPGLGFFPHENDTVAFRDCKICIKPGSGRVLSTNSDGIHARGNRHIEIEDCVFEGMGDDAVNLHSFAAAPSARLGPNEFVFKPGTYSIRIGDILEQVRPETGTVIGNYLVESVDDTQSDGIHVQFSTPIADVALGGDLRAGDQFFNLDEANNDFVIRNNVFGTHRGRDLLIEANSGVVEANKFVNLRTLPQPPAVSSDRGFDLAMEWLMGTSIQICYDPAWGQGPVTTGVSIQGNEFEGSALRSPAIWIADRLRGGSATSDSSHSGITILNNTFENRSEPAVVARYVRDLTVENNRITGKGAGGSAADVGFEVKDCPNVRFIGNASEGSSVLKLADIAGSEASK